MNTGNFSQHTLENVHDANLDNLKLENERLAQEEYDVALTLYSTALLNIQNIVNNIALEGITIDIPFEKYLLYFTTMIYGNDSKGISPLKSEHLFDAVELLIIYLRRDLYNEIEQIRKKNPTIYPKIRRIMLGDGHQSLPYMVVDSFIAKDVKSKRLEMNRRLGLETELFSYRYFDHILSEVDKDQDEDHPN